VAKNKLATSDWEINWRLQLGLKISVDVKLSKMAKGKMSKVNKIDQWRKWLKLQVAMDLFSVDDPQRLLVAAKI
jgi:hypothetical protein